MADTSISPSTGQLRLASRRPQVVNLSALTNARSGIARAGITRSGYSSATVTTLEPFLDIAIHDDLRVQHVDEDSLSIEMGLSSEPSRMTALVAPRGRFEIAEGQEIKVYLGGVETGVPLFAGNILRVTEFVGRTAHDVEYQVDAVDYSWLLDRFALVNKSYYNKGVNTIVADLLANFTDSASGFTPGYLASGLGTVGFIRFENQRLTECLKRLTETVDGGAFWEVDAQKQVSVYTEPSDEGNTLTVADGGTWRRLTRERDLSDVVTRVVFIGGGSKTTSNVTLTDTTIPVEETGWYNPAGGDVHVQDKTIAYTGVSIGSGPGNLEGVTITQDIPEGTDVNNRAQADDTDAQAVLAARLGGGQSGVSIFRKTDRRLGYERTTQSAEALLDALKTPQAAIQYHIVPSADADQLTSIRPGRLLTAGITVPVQIQGSFRVRRVRLSPFARTSDGHLVFARSVTASLNRRVFAQAFVDSLEAA